MTACPICLSADQFPCEETTLGGGDGNRYDCDVCGTFIVSRSANLGAMKGDNPQLTKVIRAVLSHRTRLISDSKGGLDDVLLINTETVRRLIEETPSLTSPGQQATNAIRFIGDHVIREFEALHELPPSFHSTIGAPNRRYAERLVKEIGDQGLLTYIPCGEMHHPDAVMQIDLTLMGWGTYDSERRGEKSSNFGFIALKFGDSTLDPLLSKEIKPRLSKLGYTLTDLRDVSRAGVIDNILRAQIRDAAFVIVDLTHDNPGAYWEAGYAEGLGKPVIYICERAKFQQQNTHFDTNHCTTVMWDIENPDSFVDELGATIRRSLDYT